MPTDHDSGYRYLFADPAMMRDLLTGFVPHEWVADADFSTLERVNGSYVSDDLRRRGEIGDRPRFLLASFSWTCNALSIQALV